MIAFKFNQVYKDIMDKYMELLVWKCRPMDVGCVPIEITIGNSILLSKIYVHVALAFGLRLGGMKTHIKSIKFFI